MGIWIDDLCWCPSQCYAFDGRPDGTFVCLYLRWRNCDPWKGYVIRGLASDELAYCHLGEWSEDLFAAHGLWFGDGELEEAKRALLCLYKTGEPPEQG